MLFNPTFPQDELDKWKNQQLSQLQQVRAQPEFLATERFLQAMYPNDRRSFVLPSADGVRAITREMVVAHYNRVYRPEGGRITVLGDVTGSQITPKLEKLLGEWKGAAPKPPELTLPPQAQGRRVILVNRPNSVQTALYIGNHAIDRLSPDYIPVQVLNRVLGGGPASRLFRNLREDKGYTYGIGSGFSATRYFNHFASQTSVRTEVTGEALRELLKEFADIRDQVVPAGELENAKRALVASFALSTENPGTALSNATQIREYRTPGGLLGYIPGEDCRGNRRRCAESGAQVHSARQYRHHCRWRCHEDSQRVGGTRSRRGLGRGRAQGAVGGSASERRLVPVFVNPRTRTL